MESKSNTGSPSLGMDISRRHGNTTHVFPATGMSTYYSAGKRGSAGSSASNSPMCTRADVRPTHRHTNSGTYSISSTSSGTSSRIQKASPASTLSSVCSSDSVDTGVDATSDTEMAHITPKFRTVVSLSNDQDRDNVFPQNGHPSKTDVLNGDKSSGNTSGMQPRDPMRSSRQQSPGGSTNEHLKQTTDAAARMSAKCDSNGGVPVTEHNSHHFTLSSQHSTNKTKISVDTTEANSTAVTPAADDNKDTTTTANANSSPASNNMNLARRSSNSNSLYENFTPMHASNGHVGSQHNGINNNQHGVVMLHIAPDTSHNMNYANIPLSHTQVNGSTGAPSDVSDSLDSDGSSLNLESSGFGFQHRFHMDQQLHSEDCDGFCCNVNNGVNGDGVNRSGTEEHPFLAGQRDVLRPTDAKEAKIMSSKGTVRGLKNLVRAGIATFAEKQEGLKNYRILEKGKVVVYTTSVMIVRETYDKCIKVKKILQTHMIKFEERDIFMSREHQKELNERLGNDKQDIPQVFADGQHIGSMEEIERLNESGDFRRVFKPFKRVSRLSSCMKCGGYCYIPCTACHGSKKSQNRNYFTEEFFALRCTHCDENGLIRCDLCTGFDDVPQS